MLGDEEEVVSSGDSEEFSEIDKMTKFYKDLNAIKERNKELKNELLKDGNKESKLTKHEQKEVKKLLKEQDKLER
jgi:hypothetical protein